MNWTFLILLFLCLIVPIILVDIGEGTKKGRAKRHAQKKKERKATAFRKEV